MEQRMLGKGSRNDMWATEGGKLREVGRCHGEELRRGVNV